MKGGVSSEAEPPTKKQKKVKKQNESEADAAEKGSSEKEGSKELELENKATLTTIVSTLDIISRKFDQVDSRLEAYELDRNRPLMDQKTINDRFLLQKLLRMIRLLRIQPMDAAAGASVLLRVRKPMRRKKQRRQMLRLRGMRRLRLGNKLLRITKKRLKLRKKVAEAKKKETELKKKQEAELKKQKQTGSNSLADITDEFVAEQNEFAMESDVENSEVVRSAIIKDYREKNVRILIHERPWPENEYG
ncbi:unnamed protein product [Brassica oleracea]